MPLSTGNELFRCTEGVLAYAGRSLFEEPNPPHAHSFMEIDIVLAGTGTHLSMRGPDQLQAGDVLVLRPGAWHGYDDCHQLLLHSCCFSTDLLSRELAWTREDLQLCYLLTTGP